MSYVRFQLVAPHYPEGIPNANPGLPACRLSWVSNVLENVNPERVAYFMAMPQSLACLYVHATFSTKDRVPFLHNVDLQQIAHALLGRTSANLGSPVVAVGGVEDHVHVLARLSRTMSVAEWIKEMKRPSSIFLKGHVPRFAWQGGYAAFSVDPTRLEQVTQYVRNQREHHAKESFQDELRRLLREHGIEWDEQYLWD